MGKKSKKKSYVILIGNPVDGLEFIGPFDDGNEATEYAEVKVHRNKEWWLAEMEAPEEE